MHAEVLKPSQACWQLINKIVDTTSLETVHSPTFWMLRSRDKSDIFNWTDRCPLWFFWMWEEIIPFTLVSSVPQSSTVSLQTWAALMDHLCCSGGHFRRTRLELASCVLSVISWASVSIKYFLLKRSKMGSVSYTELWLRPSLRHLWNMAPKSLNLFSLRGKIYVICPWIWALWLLD